MNTKSLTFVVVCFLILIVGCEKPTKVEIIWGEVISVNGHYCKDPTRYDYEPADCRIVAQFEKTEVIETYLVDYAGDGPTSQFDYNKCRKALLLKDGDRISAIKRTWADKTITYELTP